VAAPRSSGGRRPPRLDPVKGGGGDGALNPAEGRGGDNALDLVERGGGDGALDSAEVVVAACPCGHRGGEGGRRWAPLMVVVAVRRSWSSSSSSGPKLRAADRLHLAMPPFPPRQAQ
jgi:hypothetical protein